MRRNSFWAVLFIFLPALLFSHNNTQAAEGRMALLIGNSEYRFGGRLVNPVNDVRAMKTALEDLGFEVFQFENCTRKSMKEVMDDFGSGLKGQDIGLFFYAGHGVQVNGYN